MYTSEVDDPWRLNMTEASCFRKLREDPRQEIAYSGVMRHGADQVESFMVLLPLRAANGVFLGALGAQIDLAYFERLLGSLDVGGRGFLAIWRSDDFSLVLRRPPLPPELARRRPITRCVALSPAACAMAWCGRQPTSMACPAFLACAF